MGQSKTYMGKPAWKGDHSNRGKESKYTSAPAARMEGTHMSGEGDYGRKESPKKGGGEKSRSISGPQRHKDKGASY